MKTKTKTKKQAAPAAKQAEPTFAETVVARDAEKLTHLEMTFYVGGLTLIVRAQA